jgi:futalosine hydrolase
MKILVVSATDLELKLLREHAFPPKHEFQFATHGVGVISSLYKLNKLGNPKPDLILQVGLAGSYNPSIELGETVFVHTEILGDEGAEDNEALLDLYDLKLRDENEFPFTQGKLPNPNINFFPSDIKAAKGLTVNLSAGNGSTIERRKNKFNPDIESMEGACLHYICLLNDIPFIQIRTISNVVEPRCKENWNIPLALKNNYAYTAHYLEKLATNEN